MKINTLIRNLQNQTYESINVINKLVHVPTFQPTHNRLWQKQNFLQYEYMYGTKMK